MRLTLGGQAFELSNEGATWVLRSTETGRIEELSSAEVNYLLQGRADFKDLERRLELGGVHLPAQSQLGRALAHVRGGYDETHLPVMLDTTGVRNSLVALEHGVIGPLGLLDLAVLTHAVVCHDVVLVPELGPYWRDKLDTAPPVFAPVDLPHDVVQEDLWSVLGDELGSRRTLEGELGRSWQELLASPQVPRIDLDAFDAYQASPGQWDGIVASTYADLAVRAPPDEPHALDEFLSIQSIRAFFNDRLASMLGVPYLASSLRAPVMRLIVQEKAETRSALDRLFAGIGTQSPPNENDPYMQAISAPPLLAMALRRMQHLSDFWLAVSDLRAEFTPLRDRLRRGRTSKDTGDNALLRRYAAAMASAPPSVGSEAAGDVAGQALAVVGTTAGVPTAAAGLLGKAFGLTASPLLRRAVDRIFRPDVFLVGNVAHEARTLLSAQADLVRLWQVNWSREQFDSLQRIAQYQTHSFLQSRGA